jgi:uncharacterized phage protein (TIGR02220 family)
MKRFTDTDKFRDPWYRRLSSPAKQLWDYLCLQCDKIGLVEVDFTLISQDCGQKITPANMAELGDRVEDCGNGKFFIPKFIHFQYGELTDKCPPHRSILQLIAIHNLSRVGLLYHYPTSKSSNPTTLTLGHKTRQEEEEEEEKDKKKTRKEKETVYSPDSRAILHYLNEKTGRSFREQESSLAPINARLNEPGVDAGGCRKMIDRQVKRWKGKDQEEYLRPQTLFGKQNFDSYYAAKDLPFQPNGTPEKPTTLEPKGQLQEKINVRTLNL